MVKVAAYTKTGNKQESTVALDASIFGVEANHQVIDLAYRAYLAAGRSAHASTLTRGLVSGGGKKPWRQKGTGRARVGSSRVPNWRHGGVVFGPTGNENYEIKVPTTLKRQAIRQSLSAKAAAKAVSVIEPLQLKEAKTKEVAAILGKLKLDGNILLVLDTFDSAVMRATANIPGLTTVTAKYLNVFTIINADHILITKPALDIIGQWLGSKPAVAKPVAVKPAVKKFKPGTKQEAKS